MKNIKVKELWHSKSASLIKIAEVQKEDSKVLIESLFSLISTGTEKTMITESFDKKTSDHMAVPYMKGNLNKEFTYGYSLVGRVLEGPIALLNKRVHLMHPHQNIVCVEHKHISLIPEEIDSKTATLSSNMETVVNAIWDSKIDLGDKVLVVGYGIIGALLASVLNLMPGIEVDVLEQDKYKIGLAQNRGLSTSLSTGYNIVFNTTSSSEVLHLAFEKSLNEAKIIELSWLGNKTSQLILGKDFHWGRKQLISSQVSIIPNRKTAQWDYSKRKNLVFTLLKEIETLCHDLQEIPFKETPAFYRTLRTNSKTNFGSIIKY